MASSILTLKVDDREYTASLRDAKKGMLALEQTMRDAGKSFDKADKAMVDYARGIGQMVTQSQTAKGKISEMTQAFTELSMQYQRLTEEEKNSTFGQSLAQSLGQLRERIVESKGQLDQVNQSLQGTNSTGNETSSVMNELAKKFTINFDAVKLLNVGLSVAKGALDVAKDAFLSSEASVDEWGRTMEASRSLYESFLYSLNNSDVSGFLSRIGEVVNAAKAAYDAIDTLGTLKTINAAQISKQQKENDRIRLMIQTGTYMEPKDGRAPTPGLKDGQRLTPQQIRVLEGQLKNGITNVANLIGTEVQQATTAINAVYTSQAKNLGMSPQEFQKGTSSWAEFNKRAVGGGKYADWENERETQTKLAASFVKGAAEKLKAMGNVNPYAQYKGWEVFRVDGDAYKNLVQMIVQRDQREGQIYSMQGQAYRAINRVEGISSRIGGGGSVSTGTRGGGGGVVLPPEGSIAAQEAKVQALTKAWREASDQAGRDGYLAQLNEAKEVLDAMQGKVKEVIPEGSFKALNKELNDLQKSRELLSDPIDVAVIDAQIEHVKDSIAELNGKGGKASAPVSLTDKIMTRISDQNRTVDENTFTNLLEFQIKNGLENLKIPKGYLEQAIFGDSLNISDEYWMQLADDINAQLAELGIDPIKIDVKTGEIVQVAKQVKVGWQAAAQAIQSVGSALQGIENPAIKVMGIVGEAIANIALGFAQATSKTAGGGPAAWIAAIAGGLGTMISTISAIKSATAGYYAEGGIVPGNSYSGDNRIINVNSGELILNRAQQSNLAGQLTGGAGNLHLSTSVSAEEIRFVLDSNGRRTGRGEYITKKFQ